MPKDQPFYLVWNPATGYTNHRHSQFMAAKQEAARLARANTGHEFIILSPCLKIQKNDIVETEYDEIPF